MQLTTKQAFLALALLHGSNALALRLPSYSHGLAVRDQAFGSVSHLATLKTREDDDDDEEAAPAQAAPAAAAAAAPAAATPSQAPAEEDDDDDDEEATPGMSLVISEE